MNALEALARDLPGVPAELRGLAGIRPDPERLFIAGKKNFRLVSCKGSIKKVTDVVFILA